MGFTEGQKGTRKESNHALLGYAASRSDRQKLRRGSNRALSIERCDITDGGGEGERSMYVSVAVCEALRKNQVAFVVVALDLLTGTCNATTHHTKKFNY